MSAQIRDIVRETVLAEMNDADIKTIVTELIKSAQRASSGPVVYECVPFKNEVYRAGALADLLEIAIN